MTKVKMFRVGLLVTLGFFISAAVKADTVTLASVGTAADAGQTNSNGATIAISPNSDWAAALPGSSWVSYGSTGSVTAPGFFVVPNGTVVAFTDVFSVPGTPSGGTLTVMADDSAAVYLNGTLLMAEGSSTNNTYATCSDFGIGCLTPTTINLPAADLNLGSNTLVFDVAQRNGVSFGLDYLASITDPSSVPEPGMALLMMVGLVGVGGASFFRKPTRLQRKEPPVSYAGASDVLTTYFPVRAKNEETDLDEFEVRRRAFFS